MRGNLVETILRRCFHGKDEICTFYKSAQFLVSNDEINRKQTVDVNDLKIRPCTVKLSREIICNRIIRFQFRNAKRYLRFINEEMLTARGTRISY